MPCGEGFRATFREYWERRKRFEKIMMGLILIAIIAIIVIATTKETVEILPPNFCQTPTCLEESARIQKSVQLSVDPCENIYQFSCGNWDKLDEDERVGLERLRKRAIREIATEPVQTGDHKVVKLAKKLYQACMDDVQMEADHLTTIREVLKQLGGWPVLEGDNWNEENFNWTKTVYRVREMGYYYSLFLTLRLDYDPDVSNKKILQVATADVYSYHFDFYTWNITDAVIKVINIFGLETNESVLKDLKDVFEFVEKLSVIEIPYYQLEVHNKYSVAEYQERVGGIDWLSYINTIIGPGVQLSKEEVVLFAPIPSMINWLDVISKTPKRVLANYMLWKVVAEAVPYLFCELRLGLTINKVEITREQYCMKETVMRFNQNPFSIMAARRFLPAEKRKKVEELLINIKSELVEVLSNVDWMEKKDKKKAIERVQYLTLWVGEPVNYLDDKVLDELMVDWIENEYNDTFLSLVAQADRNYRSNVYQQLKISISESLFDKIYNDYFEPKYIPDRHTFYVPFVATQRLFFNEKRPNYLNYGTIGSLIGYQFSRLVTSLQETWSETTKRKFEKKIECMEKAMDDFLEKDDQIKWDSSQTVFLTQKATADELSHAAYKKWLKKHGEELLLVASNYTADQLFWISSATAWCQPHLPLESTKAAAKDSNFLVKVLGVSMGNDNTFAKDFKCPKGSRMNPSRKCKIF